MTVRNICDVFCTFVERMFWFTIPGSLSHVDYLLCKFCFIPLLNLNVRFFVITSTVACSVNFVLDHSALQLSRTPNNLIYSSTVTCALDYSNQMPLIVLEMSQQRYVKSFEERIHFIHYAVYIQSAVYIYF